MSNEAYAGTQTNSYRPNIQNQEINHPVDALDQAMSELKLSKLDLVTISIDQPKKFGAFVAKNIIQATFTAAATVAAFKLVDWYKARKERKQESSAPRQFTVAGQ